MKVKMLTEKDTYEQAMINTGLMDIEGVEHLSLECPKCKTCFYVPVETLKALLIMRQKPAGVV